MRRHLRTAFILWIILTVVGEILALSVNIYPLAGAEEAEIVDSAFRLLMILGVPVFTFVLAALIYSAYHFRVQGEPAEDGPPIHSNQPVAIAWLVITSALAVFVIFNPGLKGLAELRANPNADLIVQVEAQQWNWTIAYPQYDVTIEKAQALLLPAHQRVKFEVTATDVVHSFWIPAFRTKIDAVPGMTTVAYTTPNRIGELDDDFNYRVQCAELCGTGHARMRMEVEVIELDEFETWIDKVKKELAAEAAESVAQK